MTLTVDGKFGSGRRQKGTTFPHGRVTVVAVVEDGDVVEAGVVKEPLDACADVRVGDFVFDADAVDVDVSIGTGVDAAAAVDAGEGLLRPR